MNTTRRGMADKSAGGWSFMRTKPNSPKVGTVSSGWSRCAVGGHNQKDFHEVTFYALSKPLNSAALVAQAVQQHWGIENNLHWVKDVNLNEDYMALLDKNMVSSLSI
ncbi:MAG: hypothetical protein R2825_20560 [Saprospiraceae bacterium]